MSLSSVINTFANATGISKREAAKLAARHGREGLAKTLDTLSNVLDGRRVSQTEINRLAPGLASTLSSAIDRRVHGQPKPPVIQTSAANVFSTRPPPSRSTVGSRTNQPPREGEDGGWSELVLTPGSSNVYSFRYFREAGAKKGTLEVSYKSHNFHPGSLTRGSKKHRGRQTMEHQLTGVLGGTIAGGERPNNQGVVYHYFGVPPALFTSMKQAASKGKWVWKELRIIGQIHGGAFRYSVVSPDINLASGGGYLPRRAAAAPGGGTAFRTRSLAEIGQGRRGFIVSTLSSGGIRPLGNSGGFTTRPLPPGKRR